MNDWLFVVGILLVVLAIVDSLWTTLWAGAGSGPVTTWLTHGAWRLLRALIPARHNRLLTLAGPFTLTLVLAMWIVMLWVGWTLVFGAAPEHLVYASSQQPVDLGGRIYFVAYTLFTLGNGEIQPQGSGWQMATVLTTGSGLVLITLSISYVLAVVSAVVEQRSLAMQITGMGMSPEAVVCNTWDGQRFAGMDHQLLLIASKVGLLVEQLLAYPIVQVYYTPEGEKSVALAVVILDEALTLWAFGVQAEQRVAPVALRSARSAIKLYLETLGPITGASKRAEPPIPDLRRLQDVGIGTVAVGEFERKVVELAARRRSLASQLAYNRHAWPTAA